VNKNFSRTCSLPRFFVRWTLLAGFVFFVVLAISAQAPNHGIVKRYSELKLPPDDDVKCLRFELENGDPNTGPSTGIMKAPPNCVVPPHYHTAEEQLMIVRGNVSTGMEGMSDVILGPGGFAMMPGKRAHWFTCTGKEECVMFVTFDRAYDIVWVKDKK